METLIDGDRKKFLTLKLNFEELDQSYSLRKKTYELL